MQEEYDLENMSGEKNPYKERRYSMPECRNIEIRDTKYGAQQKCPNCGVWNRSGLYLPKSCAWCDGKEIPKPIKIKVFEKEAVEWDTIENEYTLDELWDEFDGLEDNIIRPLITIIRTQQLEIRKLKNNDREKLLDRIKEDQIKMQELKDKLAIIKSTINC